MSEQDSVNVPLVVLGNADAVGCSASGVELNMNDSPTVAN